MSVTLGNRAIMFGNSKCPACLAQYKMINDHYNNMGKKRNISYYDLEKFEAPYFLLNKDGSYAMPSWYLPTGKKSGKIHTGLIKTKFNQLTTRPTGPAIKKTKLSRNPGGVSKASFGSIKTPAIGTLKKYGKNFPDQRGMQITKSFMNRITDKWGTGNNALRAGTIGREFGPKKFNKVYSNKYYNGLRMARPGGDLDTLLSNNRRCNIERRKSSKHNQVGLIYNSRNQQIVGFNNFGKKRRKTLKFKPSAKIRLLCKRYKIKIMKKVGKKRVYKSLSVLKKLISKAKKSLKNVNVNFGKKKLKKQIKKCRFGSKNLYGRQNLYYQMGPPYGHRGNNYLMKKNTVRKLYGGATQRPQIRPRKVKNSKIFLSRSRPSYKPNFNLMFDYLQKR